MANKNAQMLTTTITLFGKVDDSFTRLGNTLGSMGDMVNRLGKPILDFEKQSVKAFSSYDDVMRNVQALGEFSNSTVRQLTDYNRTVAQTSRYTMEQAATAEQLMAQLGLTLEQQRTLMPSVMSMATAGNLQLKDSLDYLYYSLNALGKPMDYVTTLSDQMSKTAAISAADIDTLGASLQRLGSASKFFTGGSSELLAILGGISGYGQDMQGENAGTQLRNFMLTLLAPTKSKAALMNELQISEAEYTDFEDYISDAGIDFTTSAATMEKIGFSAYDRSGALKSGTQIIADLAAATSALSESERNAVIGQMFGKRTTVTALNLINSLDTIRQMENTIEGGSRGYTSYMEGIIEGGIGGSIRNLQSSWDALKVTVGDTLDEEVASGADMLTNLINSITNMDSGKMEALTKGFGAFALTGPALTALGFGAKMLGRIFTPTGMVGLLLAAVPAIGTAIEAIKKVELEKQFGEMEIDTMAVANHLSDINAELNSGYGKYYDYRDAVDAAVTSYETAAEALSQNLFTAMVTDADLTEADKKKLMGLGDDMYNALMDGIDNGYAARMNFMNRMFGVTGDAEENGNYRSVINMLGMGYDNAVIEAKELGEGMRDALTAAFADGEVTEQEYNDLVIWFTKYNEAMARAEAEAKSREEYAERQKLFAKGQRVSLESLSDYNTMVEGARDEELSAYEDRALSEWFATEYDWESLINAETDPVKRRQMRREMERSKASYMANMEIEMANRSTQYDEMMIKAYDSALLNSDFGETYGALSGLAQQVINGEISLADARYIYDKQYGGYGKNTELANQLTLYSQLFGGLGNNEMVSKIQGYQAAGNTEMATSLSQIYAMYALANSMGYAAYNGDAALGFLGDRFKFGYAEGFEAMYADNFATLNIGVEVDDPSDEAMQMRDNIQEQMNYNPINIPFLLNYPGSSGSDRDKNVLEKYAEGGRADSASIFGEAGAEWAIPERHDERTAELLKEAAMASGFTWAELLDARGGLNAGGSYRGGTLVYSPTIYANDASGVEKALEDSFAEMNRWYSEKMQYDRAVTYA